jgi:phage gp36-like protein
MYLTVEFLKSKLSNAALKAAFTDDEYKAIITDESDIIDEYLQTCVDNLPFTGDDIPKIIKRICLNLCLYQVYYQKAFQQLPEAIREDKKEAYKLMDKIKSGDIAIQTDYDLDESDAEMQYQVGTQYFSEDL